MHLSYHILFKYTVLFRTHHMALVANMAVVMFTLEKSTSLIFAVRRFEGLALDLRRICLPILLLSEQEAFDNNMILAFSQLMLCHFRYV